MKFLLRGSQKNRNAVGARVEVKTAGQTLIREVKSDHHKTQMPSGLTAENSVPRLERRQDVEVRLLH
ncbi:MAG: hypothetical protein ACRD1R_04580 [Acidobacteriota bacterium]